MENTITLICKTLIAIIAIIAWACCFILCAMIPFLWIFDLILIIATLIGVGMYLGKRKKYKELKNNLEMLQKRVQELERIE